MNVKKFVAASPRDALKKVKEALGSDAIILSNRGVPDGVEIMAVAAKDMAMIVPDATISHSSPVKEPVRKPIVSSPWRSSVDADRDGDLDYTVSLSLNKGFAQPALTPSRPAQSAEVRGSSGLKLSDILEKDHDFLSRLERLGQDRDPRDVVFPQRGSTGETQDILPPRDHTRHQLPVAATIETRPSHQKTVDAKRTARQIEPSPAAVIPAGVMEEIRTLRKMVEQNLVGVAWGESSKAEPVKTEILRHLLDAGFSPKLARDLLSDLPQNLELKDALAWVKSVAERNFITLGAESDIVDRGGFYALVGPTGVGKTTTTAKLAARCVLKHGPNKVALVTTDSYRIGAYEQLRIYGRILGVSVYMAKDADELKQTLAELKYKHMVLIDTMGMSQKDKMVPDLNNMLYTCNVRRLLLLSATSRGDTLDDIIRAYQGQDLAGCVLTKVDEAASLAPSLDAIIRHSLRLHYVSNGQRVPEDLHLPNRGYLIHRAFKDAPESVVHHYDGLEPALVMASSGMDPVSGRKRG